MNIRISLVFPAFNEEHNIERVVDDALTVLRDLSDDFEIMVVNDGSTDQTASIADRLASTHNQVKAIHHPVNAGYGAALRSGFAAARFEHVFFIDSDRQFDCAEIRSFLPYLGTYDIVTGYRRERRDPLIRKLNAFGWNIVNRIMFGIRLRDINCAFKCINRSVFERITLTTNGAMINAELYAKARLAGLSIHEIPVSHFPRAAGTQTGANIHVIVRAFRELLRIRNEIRKNGLG